MGQAQINVRTRACSRTSIARTKQAALTHNVRGKELKYLYFKAKYMGVLCSNDQVVGLYDHCETVLQYSRHFLFYWKKIYILNL